MLTTHGSVVRRGRSGDEFMTIPFTRGASSRSHRAGRVAPVTFPGRYPGFTQLCEPAQRYEIRFQPAARRAIAQRLPEAAAAAVLEFCDSSGVSGSRSAFLTSHWPARTNA